MSSAVEPFFLPLILFGLFAACYLSVRLGRWLLQLRRQGGTTPFVTDETRRRSLDKLLASLLLWLGLLLFDVLALAYVFVQGDEERVLPGWFVAAMLLAGCGLIAGAVWFRSRLYQLRTLGRVGSHSDH